MGRPTWITKEGDLGVISERQFYNLRFDVYDPDGGALTYTIVGGSLPIGLSLKDDGFIEGIPTIRKVFIRGVPVDVAEDVTNRFAVRVTTETGHVADRTFRLTVSGQDDPIITTTETDFGSYFDGTYFEYQLSAVDLDGDKLTWYVKEGSLPNGLTLDSDTGIISGFLDVTVDPTQNLAGFTNQVYDNDPWDFSVRSLSRYFQFTIGVTDGKADAIKEFKLYVISKDGMTADSTEVTADNSSIITVDTSSKRSPVITVLDTDLGTVEHDNYFAFKVEAKDFDGDRLIFVEDDAGLNSLSELGLTLHEETGWITGYIPVQTLLEVDYQFGVRAVKRDYPDVYSSELTIVTMTVVNDIGKFITWDTPEYLGVVSNGDHSTLQVSASNEIGTEFKYRYKSGRLPNGITILENGLISGRFAFNSFSIDGGTTTFDVEDRRVTSTTSPTTFDELYYVTVEAYDQSGTITSDKTFYLKMDLVNNIPYDNLYIKGHMDRADRSVFKQLMSDTSIFDPNMIYRDGDPFFGKASSLRSLIAVGLSPDSPAAIQNAVAKNHYNKRIYLGDIKTARALDINDNVLYEVVYYELIDSKATSDGVSISNQVNLGNIAISGGFDNIIYPNSFQNMRNEVYKNLTQVSPNAVPLWMKSKQEDGLIPGLVNAVVVCYTKPGYSDDVAFKLKRSTIDLKELNVVVDRYIWDNNLSDFYDLTANKFISSAETTLDKFVNANPFLTVAGVADFATERPFVEINGRNIFEVVNTGGIDTITSVDALVGKTIIFAKQENYDGYSDYDTPWQRYLSKFEQDAFDTGFFDHMDIVPGEYDEDNERTGIYRITVDSTNVITLELVGTVDTGDAVDINIGGLKYGGKRLILDPTVESGNTVPAYREIEGLEDGIQTTFDGNGTRFFAYKDVYAIPDAGDAYVKFPQVGVFE